MGRLAGKVAVVTGASSGIGEAIVTVFAREGADIVGVSRDADRLKPAACAVEAEGRRFIAAVGDLGTDAGAEAAMDEAASAFDGYDILVNSAGVGYSYRSVRPHSMAPLDATPAADWDAVISVNLGSVVRCTRVAVPVFRKRGGGSIISVASILGHRGHIDAHAYTAAKGAIINLNRSLAVTYGPDNIRSNVVSPGFIETPMTEAVIEQLNSDEYRYQWNPLGRMGRPAEIAYACLFFASDEASYCNGADLIVDGGTIAKTV
jgi:meso-butanediol dehydrogenase/(S,S)-butanediol dehydrogenase/diacetyl reductase